MFPDSFHAVASAPGPRVLREFSSEHGECLEDIACPLCGSVERTQQFQSGDLLYGQPGRYPVVRCNACSLQFVTPRPTFASLGVHYPDDYFCYVPAEAGPLLLKPFLHALETGSAHRRVGFIEKAIGNITKDQKLVDVGCGLNTLLRYIRDTRGAEGLGIDMKPTMVERSKALGLPVKQGTFLEAHLPEAEFDLVAMIEYLEHEPQPMSVLHEARRVLKTGGHVAIEIPDIEGWPARTFKDQWANLDVPRHLVFFDRATLTRALSDAGFELVSYERFAVPGILGVSMLHRMGRHNKMRSLFETQVLAGLVSLPFTPALPWLPEFVFAVSRAI